MTQTYKGTPVTGHTLQALIARKCFEGIVCQAFERAEIHKSALWQNYFVMDADGLRVLSFPSCADPQQAWERAAHQQNLLDATLLDFPF